MPGNPSRFFLDEEEYSITHVRGRTGAALSLGEVNTRLHHLIDELGGHNVRDDGAGKNGVDCDALAPAKLFIRENGPVSKERGFRGYMRIFVTSGERMKGGVGM